jgi:predicted metal-dependent phosphoesterase TrpH
MGFRAAQRWLEDWQQRTAQPAPTLWSGVEINADLLGVEVHILGYAFDPHHFSMTSYLLGQSSLNDDYQAHRVIAAIHAAGGLAVLAHPVRYRRSPEELIPEAARLGIDGVETYYAYDNPSPWRTSPLQTARVEELSRTYNLLNTCGTDTHGLSLLQRL